MVAQMVLNAPLLAPSHTQSGRERAPLMLDILKTPNSSRLWSVFALGLFYRIYGVMINQVNSFGVLVGISTRLWLHQYART